MKLVSKVKTAILAASFVFATVAKAGVPVIDPQMWAMWKAYLDGSHPQMQQLAAQLKELEDMKSKFTGMYDDAKMYLDDLTALHNIAPEFNVDKLLPTGLTSKVNELRSNLESFEPTSLFNTKLASDAVSLEVHQGIAEQVYGDLAVASQAHERAIARRPHLEELAKALRGATTQKEISDINARYNAEQVLMLNDLTELMAMQIMIQQRNKVSDLNSDAAARAQVSRIAPRQ